MLDSKMLLTVGFFLFVSRQSVLIVMAEQELRIKPFGGQFTKSLNTAIVFTCEVTEAGHNIEYSLQWIDNNNVEIVDKTGRVYVEEEEPHVKKLYITAIEQNDGGTYSCRAMLDGTRQEKKFTLTLFKDITFDHAPSPQHPAIYQPALIECRVSGEPMPEVTWRYKGDRIQFGSKYQQESGGLKIQNISLEDDGEYTCRAEVEADGRYDERKISVLVHIPPNIVQGPGNIETVEGNQVTIVCRAEGHPNPKFEFLKKDNISGHLVTMQSSESPRPITIDNDAGTVKFLHVKKDDEGRYVCNANNDVGTASSEGFLKVYVKPEISFLDEITKNEGETGVINCKSQGDPTPVMSFYRGDNQADVLTSESSEPGVLVENISIGHVRMTILKLTSENSTNFTCTARNKYGLAQRTTSITVNYKPRFSSDHKQLIYIWPDKTRNITCRANGVPPPQYDWIKSERTLANNNTYHIFQTEYGSSLQVKVRESDQGWIYGEYICRAKNVLDATDLPIELRRATVPAAPTVAIKERLPTTLVLELEPPSENGGEEIRGYRVEYEEKLEEFSADTNVIRIENLKPSTTYIVRVRARNDIGFGDFDQQMITTESVRAPYPVEVSPNPEALSNSYLVRWQPPNNGGLTVTEYDFRYRRVVKENTEEPLEDWKSFVKQDDPSRPMTSYVLENLQSSSTYQLQVLAKNDIDWSQPGNTIVFTTKPDISEVTANLRTQSADLGIIFGTAAAVILICLIIIDIFCCVVADRGFTKVICLRLFGVTRRVNGEKALEEGEREHLKSSSHDDVKDDDTKDALKEEIKLEEKKKIQDGDSPDGCNGLNKPDV